MQKQTEQVFYNIGQQLQACNSDFEHLISITCYVTDITQMKAFRRGRDRFLDQENPPTSTVVQVERLLDERCMVEISAVAVNAAPGF